MLVVLHEGHGLLEVFPCEVLPQNVDLVRNHGDLVAADDDAFHLHGLDLLVPLVLTHIRDLEPFLRICLQHFLYQIFVLRRDEPGNYKVTRQNLLVQLVRVWVFKGEVAAGHRVQDDAARPDV